MSQRLAMIARILGVLGVVGGAYLVLASWAVALPAYAVSRVVVPRLVFSEPLIWFGLALLLSPRLARVIAETSVQARSFDDDGYASAAYIHCPECEQLVRVGADHCLYCGEPLNAPSARTALARSTQRPR